MSAAGAARGYYCGGSTDDCNDRDHKLVQRGEHVCAEAVILETTMSLKRTAWDGAQMALQSARGSDVQQRYHAAMQATIAFAVKKTAQYLLESVSLKELYDMRARNMAMRSPLYDLPPAFHLLSTASKCDVIDRAMVWMWTDEILDAAISSYPDTFFISSGCQDHH